MNMSVGGRPKGHLWLVLAVLVAIAMLGEAARSLSPPSLSSLPTYAPTIKVIGKAYCYRCFNEAHPEESHGKEHLEGEIFVMMLLSIFKHASAVSLEILKILVHN
jgi:hypothetical protein